jgi:hypothetical protein
MTSVVPLPGTYWLIEGRLLAGRYPGSYGREVTRARLERLIEAGIRSFIDLTQPDDGLDPYNDVLDELARERGIECRYQRFAIRDLDIPTVEHMQDILLALRAELQADRPTYVHCWGGIGRTGTVVGCWLVEQGLTGDEAIERIRVLRRGSPSAFVRSPETGDQCEFVRAWRCRDDC